VAATDAAMELLAQVQSSASPASRWGPWTPTAPSHEPGPHEPETAAEFATVAGTAPRPPVSDLLLQPHLALLHRETGSPCLPGSFSSATRRGRRGSPPRTAGRWPGCNA
jgi:hypothetical protein